MCAGIKGRVPAGSVMANAEECSEDGKRNEKWKIER